jgi:cell division protein FtsI/penicillin-binding protein 2
MNFELQHTDPNSNARAGKITTDHGVIETPIFMPVGTVASVKAVHFHELKEDIKAQIILGNTYHLSIGQGDLGVSPIQVNQMTNVIANDGKKCKMSLLKDSKVECNSLNIKMDTVATIKEGMKAVCKTGGTAWPLFNFKTQLACKTGTAEVGDGSKDTHAWLTAFAPADNPQISITVFVERGGEGSDVAAPIVGDILKEWFNEPETLVPRYANTKVGSS